MFEYDDYGRLEEINAGSGLVYLAYQYVPKENNIEKIHFHHRGPTVYNQYGYDDIDRLTAVTYHNSDTESFLMDDLGNRTGNQTLRQEGTVNFAVDPLTNRYTAIAGHPLAYDAAGNLTQDKDGYQFSYDYENRIVEVRNSSDALVAEFDYDTQGRRIHIISYDSVPSAATLYYYSDNWQVLAEYDGSDVQQAYYVFGNYIDEVLVMCRNSTDYYYLHDHLYSPVALLSATGAVVERYEYDAYGKVQILTPAFSPLTSSQYGNPYYFTGREVDWFDNGNLLLQHNRRRPYSQYMGRWYTPDPGGYVDGLNLYEYVRSMPVIAVDFEGKSLVFIWLALEWLENRYINRFIPSNDPGRELAEELMEHYVIGVGSYKKHEGKWGDFMRERPELQDAFSDKMGEIAKKLCSGNSTSGSISETIIGENNLLPYRLNRLASMRMTLHDPKNAIKIEDRYEVKNPRTKCYEVIFKDVKFTWVDTGELTDYMSTRLDGGVYVPDTYFMELEEKYLKYIPTSGPYPIEISWMVESAWKVHESQYSYVGPRVEYLWGWPHPSNEVMQPMPSSPGHR